MFNLIFGNTFLAGLASAYAVHTSCDQGLNNITVSEWFTTPNDTIHTIAAATGTGVCDLARYNKMADPNLMIEGETLLIPKQICPKDDTTCFMTETDAVADCILGGPHLYITLANDTLEYVSLYKFGITVDAMAAGISVVTANESTEIIPTGSTIKVPQCDPSSCTIAPYQFLYGTYKDIAPHFGTTVGQIMALNPTYNYSQAGYGDGPIITMPMNCKRLADNVTSVS